MTEPTFFATTYDRAACAVGIVHVGYGAFHRAHMAVYVDDYMQQTGDLRWGIAAVNLRAEDSATFAQSAAATDGYLLKTIAPDGRQAFRSVRAHVAFADAAQDDVAASLVADPNVAILSMTVTESGYAFSSDWSLDLSDPDVAADLTSAGPDRTIYGFLCRALAARAAVGAGPITVMCCDNIRHNGAVLGQALLRFIHAKGEADLAGWVRSNVTFPNSMVDRITPRSTEALRTEVASLFPQHADMPIHAEAFTQWVIEDAFAAAAPDLKQSGAQIVQDVAPYEEAKIRILNGGHTGLAYHAALAGHVTFDAAIHDQALRALYDRWQREDVLPGLGSHLPFDTAAYLNEVTERFGNPGIADQLERICMDGFAKMGIYIRPTLDACLDMGRTPHAGYANVAAWVIYARQALAGTAAIPYHEPAMDSLAPLLAPGAEARLASERKLWGDLPDRFDRFVPDLVSAIKTMETTCQA